MIGTGIACLRGTVAALPLKLAADRRDVVVSTRHHVYRVVVSPILAATEIG